MKKITLLILMLFLSWVGYSQTLDENFDGVTAPALPTGWIAFNNGLAPVGSPTEFWTTYATNPASAPNSVVSQRYTIAVGATSQDWLATPLFEVPANGQLQFSTRKQSAGLVPSTYKVMVAPASANPALASSYTQLAVFTDAEVTNAYTTKTVPFPATYPAGTRLYVAFLKEYTRPVGSGAGDADLRWYIDDVRVNSRCLEPITLSAPVIGLNSATLSWVNQPGSTTTNWEIVIVLASDPFSAGTIIPITTTTTPPSINTENLALPAPYFPGGELVADTNYKYYVRAVCSATNKSVWTDPYFFTTAALGETCADPIVIPQIPFSTNGNTADSADRTDAIQGGSCGATPAGTNFMAGNDRFYTFTAPTTGDVRIIMSPTGTNSSIFVYSSCATVGGTCLAGVANTNGTTRTIPSMHVDEGQTYVIVLSSAAATQTYSYYLEIQYVTCDRPTNLGATVNSQTSVTLNWENPFPSAEYEYVIQPAGSGIPTAPGRRVTSPTEVTTFSTDSVAADGIVGSTAYQYWVRSLCTAGGTTYSAWAGPFEFFTPVCDPATTTVCNYEFLLRGTGGWQGAVMHVVQNGITVKVLGPQFTTGTSLSVPVSLCDGIPFELVWVTGGTAPQTVAITVRNSFAQQLFIKNGNTTDTPGTTPLFTKMVDCLFPECLPPTNPRMQGATTASTANINWTPAAATSAWEVYYAPTAEIVVPSNTLPEGSPGLVRAEGTGIPPFLLENLISDTPYQFYVRAVCGNNRKSDWVGPVSFRTGISCAIPTTPTVVSTTTTSAILNWNQPAFGGVTPDNWQVVVQPAGTGMPAYSPTPVPTGYTSNQNVLYDNLTAGTAYEYWVRAVCSSSDVSRWVGPVAFNTLCNPLPVPYSEGFNSTSATQLCWTVTSLAGANRWNMDYTTNPFEGDHSASFLPNNGTNNNDYLISPTLVLPAASTNELYRVRFKYRVESPTEPNNIEILISTAGTDPASFDANPPLMSVRTWNNVTYVERIINLNTYAGQNINVAWHLPAGLNNRNRIYIDDVVFERIPACPDPSDLIVENITSTSADLSWTPGFLETQWQVAVQPLGTGVPSATFAGALITDNEDYTVTEDYLGQPLLPGSQYEYYVRAHCNDTDQSQWVGPIVFRVLLCEDADRCAYTFTMTDTGSNTWQGSTMSVIQNGLVIATLTGPANGQRTANQVVSFCPGVQFELFWNNGTSTAAASTQVGVSITNFYGEEVYNKPPGTGTLNSRLYRGMPFCAPITCPYPTDLSVTQTSGTSVTLNWTPGGTETAWDYVFQLAGGNYPSIAPGTGVRVDGDPTANIRNIDAATPYEYYVRAVCGPDNISYWSGPYTFTIYNSPGCIGVEIEGVEISVGTEILVCPNDLCVDLSATYFQTQATTTYTVESIPYLPPYPFTGGTPIPIGTDDDWTDTVTLPFNFCFFGQTFNKLLITDNGALSFSIAGVVPGGRYTPLGAAGWQYNQQIPYNPGGTGAPYVNAVFGVLQDLYPGGSPADFSINYQVLGTAPCRAFVVSYYKAAHFSCTSDLDTSQIVLYEGSNMIDIYVEDRSVCSFNSGSGLIGLQNADATVAIVPPGRNTGQWTAQNEAWRFTPDGALSNVQFEWRKDGEFYSNDLDISVCITDETLMEAVALYDKCDGTFETRKSEVTLKIDNLPIEDPIDLKACAGVTTNFDLTQNNAVILDGVANPENYTITYYLTLPEAESGTTGAITSHETAVTTPIYVRILNTVTTCWETRTFDLVPDAALPDYTLDTFDNDSTICSGESTTIVVTPINFVVGDATYEWTLPNGDISTETSHILTVPVGTPEGVYTYTVKVNDGCETIKTYELTVSNADPVVEFRYDTPVCIAGPNPVVIPVGAALTTGGAFSVPTGSPLVFVSSATGEIDLAQTPAGTYVVTYTVAASTCSALGMDDFEITILPLTAPVVNFTYDNPTVCSNGTVTTLNPSAGLTSGGSFSVDVSGLIIDPATGIITVAGSTPGVYNVYYSITVTDVVNCVGTGTSTPVVVTINAGVDSDASFTYEDASYCANAASVVPDFINTPGGRFSATNGLIINTTTGEVTIVGSTTGLHSITYTLDGDTATCLNGDSKTFDITIESELEVTVADECEGSEYILSATPNDSSYSYTWMNGSVVISGENGPTLNVTDYVATITNPVYPMEFTVTVNNGSCDSTETFTVYNVSCNIPKGISPNGDGSNDEFDLTGFNVRKLEIFNRYGTQVYSRNNYVKEWRGQSDKGDDLPDGTYYYVIYRDGFKTATGWVQINRQRN